MTTSSPPSERSAILSWLRHGAELATALKKERARHQDVIWCLLTESIETVDAVPDQERRWLTSGRRSGGWNMIGMTRADLKEIERIRLLSAMKPYDGSTRTSPQRDDIDRAMGVLEWMRFCNDVRNPQQLTKAAIVLARGGDRDAVHRLYSPNRKPSRQTFNEIKTRTVGLIISGLNTAFGIVPGDGLTFVEKHQ